MLLLFVCWFASTYLLEILTLRAALRLLVACDMTDRAVVVVFTDGFQAGDFQRVNNTAVSAVNALSKLAASKFPDVLLSSCESLLQMT